MIHPSSNVPPPFGGTDDLHIATRQRGFQDVGRIHGATVATAAGTHQGVDLVNHQNDVRIVTHFLFSKLRNPPKKMRKKNFRKWPQHATTQRKKHMFWEAKSSWPHKNGIKANCPATNLAGWGTRAHFVQVGWDDHFIDRVEMENCLVQPKTTNQINASCFQERWSTQKWQQTCLGLRKPPSKSRF